jgi:hypothetical protein
MSTLKKTGLCPKSRSEMSETFSTEGTERIEKWKTSGMDFTTAVCLEREKDHREDAKGRKREKPSPVIHNDLDDFALFMWSLSR